MPDNKVADGVGNGDYWIQTADELPPRWTLVEAVRMLPNGDTANELYVWDGKHWRLGAQVYSRKRVLRWKQV